MIRDPIVRMGASALIGMTGCCVILAGVRVHDKLEAKKLYKLTEKTADADVNSGMLEAAFKDKLGVFKKSLEKGADITILNRYGQDAFMLALTKDDFEVASYILDTPELSNKIDYKRRDQDGICALDIMNARISNESSPKLESIKRQIEEKIAKQNKEEANGKTRSDTYYGMFDHVDKGVSAR